MEARARARALQDHGHHAHQRSYRWRFYWAHVESYLPCLANRCYEKAGREHFTQHGY